MDNILKLTKSTGYLLYEITQSSKIQLSETDLWEVSLGNY